MKKLLLIILLIISVFTQAQPTANAGIDQTLILPFNYGALYGGFPYSRKSSTSAISSFVWTQISGPNTATLSKHVNKVTPINSSDSAIFFTNLIQGTYSFRLQVTDANGTSSDTVNVVVLPRPALNLATKKIRLNDGVYYPNNAQTALNINPGDTIELNGATLDSIDAIILGNIHGTAYQPIYVVPVNGPVKVARIDFGNAGWGSGGDIRFSYIIVDGRLNGVPHQINSKQFLFYSGHHIALRYCRSDYSFQSAIHVAGYANNGNDQLKFPAMYRSGFYIHDNIVNLPTFEGVYGGATALTNQGWDTVRYHSRGDSMYIYNNTITNTGNDGIQVGGFYRAWIYNNYTDNNGINGSGGQGSGINFGTFSTGRVYNNYMRKAWRNGSFINGYDTIYYENNYLDSCAFFEPNAGNAIVYVNSSSHNPEKVTPRTVFVKNNYFRNPYPNLLTGLSANNGLDNPTRFDSNFIWRPNGGSNWYFFDDPGTTTIGNTTVSNITWPTLPLARVSGPTLDTPYTLTPPPPNIPPTANAGVDQSITLPVSSVTLSGSGNDTDGTIISYSWQKISGTGGTIVSPSSAITNVTGLSQGTYVFRLTVTDNGGFTATDDIIITVNPAVIPTIKLARPLRFVNLN